MFVATQQPLFLAVLYQPHCGGVNRATVGCNCMTKLFAHFGMRSMAEKNENATIHYSILFVQESHFWI